MKPKTQTQRARDFSLGLCIAHMADSQASLRRAVDTFSFALANEDDTVPDEYAELFIELKVAYAITAKTGRALALIADTTSLEGENEDDEDARSAAGPVN